MQLHNLKLTVSQGFVFVAGFLRRRGGTIVWLGVNARDHEMVGVFLNFLKRFFRKFHLKTDEKHKIITWSTFLS